MANKVFANRREIACKAAEGKSVGAFPDVCMTPPETPATPAGVPVPYPNTGYAKDTTKGSKTVKISGKEVMLKNKSYFKQSTGDEAGRATKKGVITGVNKGKVYFNSWSMNVKIEGKNVVRHLDLTTHNHASAPGNSPPWPYTDSMATTDDPCAKGKQEQEDHSICIGAYLDGPNDKIGHAFISVEYPKGQRTTKGFYPKNDPVVVAAKKISSPKARIFGVEGNVQDDEEYLYRERSRIKCFSITEKQAKTALARIEEYEDEKPNYHLLSNQCAVFAVRVLRAACQNIDAGFPMRPTVLYEMIGP